MKKTLYILQDGELHRKDNSLYFESTRGRKFIPVESTNDICIFGDVEVSKRFLDFCTQKHIPIHYLDIYGNYIGTYYPREHYNSGYTIIKQAEFYLDKEKRLVLAKAIAYGYIEQSLRVVRYYSNRKDGESRVRLEKLCSKFEEMQKDVVNKKTINEILLIVKKAEEGHKDSFNLIINNAQFIDDENQSSTEHARKNTIIRFGRSIGQAIILSEIYKTYLDPRIGYLHDADLGVFPLCLDILYIFKPIMIYRLIFTLLNKSMITEKDFKEHKGDVILSREGKGKFITELDKRMRTTIKHRHLGRHVSYRRIIRLELYKIQKHIIEGIEYNPYLALW
ncbi:MAG TPA: type I-B CRISPR-associated endonuclease Cas1b [Oscillospiraceae bacterium]|nr:type I-B CRISPR-associated endonuclease Cas1b [Oscillospiraceae bacterium]